jgi:hypothetical protein
MTRKRNTSLEKRRQAANLRRVAIRVLIAAPLVICAGSGRARAATSEKARIDVMDVEKKTLTLTICDSNCSGKQLTLKVSDEQAGDFGALHIHDRVTFSADDKSVLQTIALTAKSVEKKARIVALSCALIACLLLATLLTWWHPLKLIVGEDQRYSNSKFQMAVWFCVVIATYLGVVSLRVWEFGWDFLGGVNIPTNLLLLSGMSALTYAGAKGITTAKIDTAIAQGKPDPKPSGDPHFFRDLLQNDVGNFDLGDFQMLVVTFLAVAMHAATVFHALEVIQISQTTLLPNVDTTILASFGLGQGAYLTKKAAGNAGTS